MKEVTWQRLKRAARRYKRMTGYDRRILAEGGLPDPQELRVEEQKREDRKLIRMLWDRHLR